MLNPIQTALCSFGMSGKVFHAPFIDENPNFNLYGVMERSSNNAKKKYPQIKRFISLEMMLNDPNIELVVVNTPSVTHYEFAKKVIEAGKHLIVEKPFTATAVEAQELIDLANLQSVIVSVYHNRRFDSDFRTLQKIIDEGCLGEIIEAELHFDRFEPNLSAKIHNELATPAVGNLYDLGSHLIDQALCLFGMPTAVFADLNTYRHGSKVDDYFDLKLYYKEHRVILKSSYFVRENLPGNRLYGRKGTFLKSKADVQELQLQSGKLPGSEGYGVEDEAERGLLHTELEGNIIKTYISTVEGNYMAFYDGIYKAIRHNEELPVSASDGMKVIKVIEAAQQSNRDKRRIEL